MANNQLITKRKLKNSLVQYSLIIALILVAGGYLGFTQYTEYQSTRIAFETGKETLDQLKSSADKAKVDYINLKKEFDQSNLGINDAIEQILPPEEDFTILARALDDYFLNTKPTNHPMFLSDLKFNNPRIDNKLDYTILPFTMNISGDEEGFKEFLKYINTTGDINQKTRLLKITNIGISFQKQPSNDLMSGNTSSPLPNSLTSNSNLITANVQLEAYFQKPLADNLNTK